MIHIEIKNSDAVMYASIINQTVEYMTDIVALLEMLPDEYRAGSLDARGRDLRKAIDMAFESVSVVDDMAMLKELSNER
jgi:hypothetical protein